MKISYVTTYDALDIHNWSGLGYSIGKMLVDQNAEIDYIGNLQTQVNLTLKLKRRAYQLFSKKGFDISREPIIAKQYAKQVQMRLNTNSDVVFSPGSIPIALLESKKPKVFYTDATFAGMLGFYDSFSNLCSETIKHGNYLEKVALETSNLIIYSSDWAAKTAIDNYSIEPNKIKVVPFGANIVSKRSLNDIKDIINNRSSQTLNLLFIGVDWIRKGGDLAVNITKELNNLGIRTILHVVGINKLPCENVPNFIVNHGFISKNSKEGIEKIEQLFINSHFLILPTLADCTPVVYSEANSYALPCISTNVGGIPTIIKDDINGKMLSLQSGIKEWSNYISNSFADKEKYKELCMTSFEEYENRLNWNVAGKTIMNLMKEL
jgi:glycosyltransferase involved in cell wall biosynthesis